ncbi:MAG: 50S ribosomal protein L13 [Euryarchaeota archaeon]|nr:50S ribosomal protein L13 [Euryarchaeota archaeon]
MTFIDADGAVLGRLASEVAKRILKGEEITVVNAEKALVTGSREDVLDHYKEQRFIGSTRKGPYFPRMPDRILRRTVRGMLPFRQHRGRSAYKRLRVFIGVPRELGKVQAEKAGARLLRNPRFMELGEVSRLLGAKF